MEQPDQVDKAQTNVSIPQEKETHSSPSPPSQQEQDQEASLPNQLRPILSHSDSTRPSPISNDSQQHQRYYPPTIPTHNQHQQQQQPPYQRHHQASYSFQQIQSYDYYNPPPPLLHHYPRPPAQQASQENTVDDDDCGSQDDDEDLMARDGGGESRRESGYDSTTTRRTSGSSTASNLTAHQPQQFYAPFRSFQNTVSSGAGGGPNYYTYENPAPWSYSPSSLYNPYFPTQSVPPYSNFEAASQSGSRTIYSKLGSPSISPTTPASNSQLPHISQRRHLPPLPPGSSSAVPLRQPDQVPPPPPPPHASPSIPRSQSVGNSQQVQIESAQSQPRASAPEPIIRKRRAKPQNSYDIPAITGINPFICKLRYMLQNPQEFSDLICWSEQDGESILVDFGNPLLVDDLLPRVFNHSNPQAFRSQFTKYGFVALTGQSLEFALNGPQEEQQEQRPSTSFPAYASPSNPTPAPPPPPSSSSIDVGLVHQHDFSPSASASSSTFIIPNPHQQRQPQQQQQPIEGDSEDGDEELEKGERQVEEEEEEEEPVAPKVFRSSSKGWKGFRHRHTREDFESVLQSEKKNQLKKHGQKLSTTATGGEPKVQQGEAMEEEDDEEEEEEEEEEDCNWFSLETMNDLKILKRVKPVGVKSRASGQATAGKGRKKKLNEEDDEDEEDQDGGARKKASNMINSVAGVASGSGSGTRMIGGVEVPKATQEKYS